MIAKVVFKLISSLLTVITVAGVATANVTKSPLDSLSFYSSSPLLEEISRQMQAYPPETMPPQGSVLQYRADGHILGFTPERVYIAGSDYALIEEFVGANSVQPKSDQGQERGGQSAPVLSTVTYEHLWDGITLRYEGEKHGIAESFWELAPGADVGAIQLRYNTSFNLQPDGSLRMEHPGGRGWFSLSAPIAWQEIAGERRAVDVAFRPIDAHTFGYRLSHYNPALAVTIDPVLTWHTFHGVVGGSASDRKPSYAQALVLDAAGNLYVAGYSAVSWNNPANSSSPLNAHAGSFDMVILKFDRNGVLLWHTFYGSADKDYARAMALDAADNLIVVGYSNASWNNPTDSSSPLNSHAGDGDIAILKLDSNGTLLWHTFYGSTQKDEAQAVVVDAAGDLIVAGHSRSSWDNPADSSGPLNAYAGNYDIAVLKLSSNGVLQWHTFHGSVNEDKAYAVVVDAAGNLSVAGHSHSSWDNPADSSGPLNAHAGGLDMVILRLDGSGALQWHTFFGSANTDYGHALALDAAGNLYVAGHSAVGWNNPVDSSSPLNAYAGSFDMVILKLDSSGALQWHTFYGSVGSDYANAMVMDTAGNLYLAGVSGASWDNPFDLSSPLNAYAGGYEMVLLKLNSSGVLQWHTFYGSYTHDYFNALAVDTAGNLTAAGYSYTGWGVPVNAFSEGDGGSGSEDIVVARLTAADLGDAPDPGYPTLLVSDGPRHTLSGAILGGLRDEEADGQPTATANGDDSDGSNDDDGVSIPSLTVGQSATVTVTASGAGRLDAWIDFNADGDWADANEQVFTSEPVTAGANPLSITVPANAVGGDTFARFRLSSAGGLSYTGGAPDGEVEDYQLTIAKLAQTITGFAADPATGVTSGAATLNVTGSGGSGNPVTYSSGTTGICTVSGAMVTFIAAGICTVSADQAGNASYDPAPQQTLNIPVGVAATTTVLSAAEAITIAGGSTLLTATVSGAGNPTGTVAFHQGGTPVSGCSAVVLTADQAQCYVHNLAAGLYSFSARYSGDANHASSSFAAVTVMVDDPDGVDGGIEQSVPNLNGSGTGDGDGDGIADRVQPHVVSLPAHGGSYWATLVSSEGLALSDLTVMPAPTLTPDGLSFPYGRFGFRATGVTNGASLTMQLYVPYNPAITGYWKQGNNGVWRNLATDISHVGSKTRITFSLTEGGNFDSDGPNNGSVTDPGGPVTGTVAADRGATAIPALSEWALLLLTFLMLWFGRYGVRVR
ncbi:MAG: IPTL-CTERM sorting domain-containing protein [Chromatiales bacterium]|nr:IPTL-CTERM sorting domain-containing protein [Chromatiales bacterium]